VEVPGSSPAGQARGEMASDGAHLQDRLDDSKDTPQSFKALGRSPIFNPLLQPLFFGLG